MKNIHVLPTDKPSRIRIGSNGNFVMGLTQNENASRNDYFTNQNIYITSDEEIKDVRPHYGKWQLETGQILNKFPNYLTDLSECKLVIMTTDQDLIKDGVQAIDDEFLEWFVKNPTYEEVYIIKQYKQVNQDNPITKGSTALMFSHYEIHLLKANKQMIDEWNLIYCKLNNRQIPTKEKPTQEIINEDFAGGLDIGQIIPKEETKQETLLGKTISKEVADKDSFEDVTNYKIERSYSEEDIALAFNEGQAYSVTGKLVDGKEWLKAHKKEWFKQFKNK